MLAPEVKIISRVSNRTREPKDREVRSGKRRSDGCAKKRWVGAEEDTAPLHPPANHPPTTLTLTLTLTHSRARADRAEVTSDVTTRAEGGEGQGQAREAGRKPPGKQVHSVNTLRHLLLWVCEVGPEHPGGNQDPGRGGGGHSQAPVTSPATHSSTPAWEIPWTEEPGGLQSMQS